MLKFLKNLFGIGPYSESRPGRSVVAPGGAPYKVPEPVTITPIPVVPETKIAHDMGGSYVVEETTPKPKAVAKPKAPAKPKASKPAAAKAPAKPKAPATKKPKISIAK